MSSRACSPTGTTQSHLTCAPARSCSSPRTATACALVKHLDGMSDTDVVELNIPTGMPLVYELDDDLAPTNPVGLLNVKGRYLDPDAAAAAAEAVKTQAG